MSNRNRRASMEMTTLMDMLEESKIKPSLLSKLKKRLGLNKPKPGTVYRRWDPINETFYLERGAGVTLARPEQMDGGPPPKQPKKKPWQPQKGTYNDEILASPMGQVEMHKQKRSRWADVLRLRRNKDNRSLFPLSITSFRQSAVWTYSDLGLDGNRMSVAPQLAETEGKVDGMNDTENLMNETTLPVGGTALNGAGVEGGLDEGASDSDASEVSLSLSGLEALRRGLPGLSDDQKTQSYIDLDARLANLAAQIQQAEDIGDDTGDLEHLMNDTTSGGGMPFSRDGVQDGLGDDALASGSSELWLSESDSEFEELRRGITNMERQLADGERTLAFLNTQARLHQQVEPQMPESKESMQGLTLADRRGRVLKNIHTTGHLYQK